MSIMDFIKNIIEMPIGGGGGGVRRRKRRSYGAGGGHTEGVGGGKAGSTGGGEEGNNNNGNGDGICGVIHEECTEQSNDSYCKKSSGHTGDHKCESCGNVFE